MNIMWGLGIAFLVGILGFLLLMALRTLTFPPWRQWVITCSYWQTLILCDPHAAAKAKYDVNACPCVLVVDKKDDILYRNQAPEVYSERLPDGFMSGLMEALTKKAI